MQNQNTLAPALAKPSLASSGDAPASSGSWAARLHPTRKGVGNLLLIGALLGVPSVAQATDLLPLPPELGTWGVAAFAFIETVREIGKLFHSDREAKARQQENVELREALRQANDTLTKLQAQREQEQREAMRQLRDELKAMMAHASEPPPPRRKHRVMRAVAVPPNT